MLKTDNGSHQFKTFATNMGFKHQRITPIWPQANGEAEIFMRNFGKVTRSAVIEGRPWRHEMYKFLRNYRATPHSSTGIAQVTTLTVEDCTSRALPDFNICNSTTTFTQIEEDFDFIVTFTTVDNALSHMYGIMVKLQSQTSSRYVTGTADL